MSANGFMKYFDLSYLLFVPSNDYRFLCVFEPRRNKLK